MNVPAASSRLFAIFRTTLRVVDEVAILGWGLRFGWELKGLFVQKKFGGEKEME